MPDSTEAPLIVPNRGEGSGSAGVVKLGGASRRPRQALESFADSSLDAQQEQPEQEQPEQEQPEVSPRSRVSGGIQQVGYLDPSEETGPSSLFDENEQQSNGSDLTEASSLMSQPFPETANTDLPEASGSEGFAGAIPRDDRHGGPVASARHPLSPISHETSPRVPQPGEVVCPTGACPTVLGPYGPEPIDPTDYPDEYLCDGGDRGAPFHYEGYARGGLDTEDTVGEFRDETGKAHSTISSKVCIYAPRFAAVRSNSAPAVNEDLDIIAAAHDGVQLAGIDTRLALEEQTQRNSLARLDTSSRASGVRADAGEGWLGQVDIAKGIEERLISYQSLSFIQEGRIRQSEEAILSFGAQAAGNWSRDLNPVIAGHAANGHQLQAEFKVRQLSGVEDRRSPGDLRIVKLADKETAKPGDVITFTLRFDNLGERDLFDITIVDNLTPRLQYIEGSVVSKIAGGVDVKPNGEGSSILTFTFDEPLKGLTGGSVTFECRVN